MVPARRVGLPPAADFDNLAPYVGWPLCETPGYAGRYLLGGLPGRYSWHDLLRAYAAELAEADDQIAIPDLERLFHWYIQVGYTAHRLLTPQAPPPRETTTLMTPQPGLPDVDAAVAWFDSEYPNVVAAVRESARSGRHHLTWQLAENLFAYCHRCRLWDSWTETFELGLIGAQATADLPAQAVMHNGLGAAAKQRGDFDSARHAYTESLRVARLSGDEHAVGRALVNLGGLHLALEEFRLAEGCLRAATENPVYGLEPAFACITYLNLGCLLTDTGDHQGATAALLRSIALTEESGHVHNLCYAYHCLGETALLQERFAEAAQYARQAADLARQVGDRLRYARSLDLLGSCLITTDPVGARQRWRAAHAIATEFAHPFAAEMREWLAVTAAAGTTSLRRLDADHRRRTRRLP